MKFVDLREAWKSMRELERVAKACGRVTRAPLGYPEEQTMKFEQGQRVRIRTGATTYETVTGQSNVLTSPLEVVVISYRAYDPGERPWPLAWAGPKPTGPEVYWDPGSRCRLCWTLASNCEAVGERGETKND